MSTEEAGKGENLETMKNNLARVEELTQRFIKVMGDRKAANPALDGPNAELFSKAATSYWAEVMENPQRLMETQLNFWAQSVQGFMEAQDMLLRGQIAPKDESAASDKRFANPLWQTHPYFRYVREQYERNAEAIKGALHGAEGLSPKEEKKLNYFADQIVEMMCPTNFLGTNPDALEKAVATEGESLVKGLENLVADVEANRGELLVRLADETAFKLGENVATTPGKVVFRNHMMELIQYSPSTEEVYETPLVIFPPWINKYYVLDLKEQNSLIKWVVDQGYTLFVVSWVNAGPERSDIGMDDYVTDGFLKAFEVVKEICGVKQVNAVGYCIAGTTLHLTLALMKKSGDKSVKSATFFTALTDFSDQGEFTPFLQDDFIDGIGEEVKARGILRSFIMSRTMSFLRSKDLIYQPAIRSYMMGEAPPAFDLLYWNGDGANLPGRMVMEYLRGLCQRNEFTTTGFELLGERLHISDVEVPVMAVTCETDHIAAWKDCYRGFRMLGSKKTDFIVSESGHIAGIVNPPSKKKYGHYTNKTKAGTADEWMQGATFHEGSWWPRWDGWLSKHSGKKVAARGPGDSSYPALADAPGTYVLVKAAEVM